MSRKAGRGLAAALVLAVLAAACTGRAKAPGASAEPGTSSAGAAAAGIAAAPAGAPGAVLAGQAAPSSAPSPAPARPPAGRTDDLAEVAPLLPATARLVATFPAEDLREMALALPLLWPVTVRTDEPAAFAARVKAIWGVDLGTLAGACAVAVLAEGGVVATCARGLLSPVPGAHRWRDGEAAGEIVRRGDREFWVGTLSPGGRPLAGDPAAVRAVVAASRGAVPSLDDGLGRREDEMRELAGADGQRRSALWFWDRTAAPWCRDGCRATAAFWSPAGVDAVAMADPGRGEALRAAAQAWWDAQRKALAEAAARSARGDDAQALPPEAAKRADEPARRAGLALRGDRVLVSGTGDVAWLALALRQDLPGWFFGEERTGP